MACLIPLVFGLACEDQLITDPPTIADPAPGALPADPGIVCAIQHPEEGDPVVVTGGGFIVTPYDIPAAPKAALPDITLNRTLSVTGGEETAAETRFGGEVGDTNEALLSWQSQEQMTLVVVDELELAEGTGALPIGVHDLTVTNADGQSATSTGALAVVDRPRVTGVSPVLVCVAQGDQQVEVEVGGALRIDGTEASVTVGGQAVTLDELAACEDVAHAGVDAELCGAATITLAQDVLGGGLYDVEVANPEPADCSSVPSEDGVQLLVVPPPAIESINPSGLCSASLGVTTLTITGTGFVLVDATPFEVTVAGAAVTPTNLTGCETQTVSGTAIETCTGFDVSVDATGFALGAVEVAVTNPLPVDCAFTTTAELAVVDPPSVTGIVPAEICSDVASTVTIQGAGFAVTSSVVIGGVAADRVTFVSDTELTAEFDAGLAEGAHDVVVDNGGGCAGAAGTTLTVNPTPLVFFVDPPFVFNGIDVEATIFATAIDVAPAAVRLIDSGGTETDITDFSLERTNRILADIPSGLTPGRYEVAVTSDNGCGSALNGQLDVTDALTLTLDTVDPAFISPTLDTAVTVTATGAVDFASTPRLYMSPNPAVADVNAVALRAGVLVSPTVMTAVVPGGTDPGTYDLIAVNPTGEVGILTQAITVTAVEPPFVTSVAPGSLDANATSDLDIAGANFDPATATVTLECIDFATGDPVANGTVTVAAGTSTATLLDASVDAGAIPKGAVCVVVVENGDGASFRFSALSFKEPAQNLNAWVETSQMNEARRAHVLAAGRPTETTRFLWAIGGDNGTVAGAKTSVSGASVDAFGALGTWDDQRNTLDIVMDAGVANAAPRTFAGGAQVGRFVYLTGGNDGVGTVDTVLRAQILDPLAGPEISDLDAALGDDTTGLVSGLYFYQVAPVFSDTDENNPGGEGLPGEVLNVQLPQVDQGIVLTLTWEPITDAVGYRVYRTPAPDVSVDQMQLLAEVSGQSNVTLTDDGTVATTAEAPLPSGSLGVWHVAGTLRKAREAHATVAVTDPNNPARVFLYAVGGRDDVGEHADGDVAVITIAGDGDQSVGAFADIGATLTPARAELAGFVITAADSPNVGATEAFLYFGSGREGNQNRNVVEGGVVGTDGAVATLTTLTNSSPVKVGAGALSANGFLFLFGGSNQSANGPDAAAELVGPGVTLSNWTGPGGGSLTIPRIYMGTAKESAFFFVAGGDDGDGPTTSVEQTVQ
jgi:hypothetical protein